MLSIVSLLQSNNTVNLTFVGDAMQHAPQITAAEQPDGNHDYSPCFQHLVDDINWADLAVVNLECTLGGKPYTGYPCFSAPDSYAQQLRDVGFDLFLTANNHCLDRRDRGLVRTCEKLDSMGIPHIGTYRNKQERNKLIPYIVNVKGMKIAFLDYTYGTNGIRIQGNEVIVDYIDKKRIADDIALARQRGAHAICVNMHWGIEYTLKPVAEQQKLADFLVSQGVDLIIGGHPHVVEPFEMRYSKEYNKNVLLIYSLGNFISNMSDIDCRGGAMVKVSLRMENGHAAIVDPRYKLFFVQKPTSRGENYVLIPESRPDLLRNNSKSDFTRFMQRTHDLVMSNNIGVPQEQ